MDYTKCLKVKCNWQSNVDGLDIENCVVARLQQPEHESAEVDLLDLIEKSDCKSVNFVKPEDQKDLVVHICCDSNHVISKIVLYSEAKIVEMFGKIGEYVSTHNASSSENVNEFSMNAHIIHVSRSKCSLQFEQLKNLDFVWIYGILVYLNEEKEYLKKSLGPINMQNVQHLLNPESLATNASKLFSTLSLKESKSENDILNSILSTLDSNKLLNSNYDSQLMWNSFNKFEENVEDKLNSMALQLNTIGNNVETLNTKFDLLLNALKKKDIL